MIGHTLLLQIDPCPNKLMVSQMLRISGGCWGLLVHGHISITKKLALLDPGLVLILTLTWFDT